jgi:hypothetical protein
MGIYDLAVNKLGYQSWEWPNMVVSGNKVVDNLTGDRIPTT